MTASYGIIGHPLGHTLSPTLHNWGFRLMGIDALYEAWPTLPQDLPDFMEKVRSTPVQGLSVTIPHKRAVIAHLDELTARARAAGAVNTLFWRDGRLLGDNTDVAGIVEPLRQAGAAADPALVLGAGGAARAAVAALRELGIKDIAISNRTRAKADALAADFAARAVDWEGRAETGAALVINTTPLGMSGDNAGLSPWPDDAALPGTVFDLVYNPLSTRLVLEAKRQGKTVIPGLEMFLHQGLAQFQAWTGARLPADQARNLLLQAFSRPCA